MDENTKIKIRHEISRIDKSLDSVTTLLDLCRLKDPDIIEITAMAQVLHAFYNGAESVSLLILKYMNEKIPNDLKWHKAIFEMIFGSNSKNINILRDDIKKKLEKYLLFRHLIRHSYGSELIWNEMKPLANEILDIWKIMKTDFEMFMENN